MSKLFDHIKAYQTRDRTYVQKPLKMVDFNEDSYSMRIAGEATIYRFEARLGAQMAVTDETKEAVDWQLLMKQLVYKPLAEEIFGEFREPLIEAEFAIRQGRDQDAIKLIDRVLKSMFDV